MKRFFIILLIISTTLLAIYAYNDFVSYKKQNKYLAEVVDIFDKEITSTNNSEGDAQNVDTLPQTNEAEEIPSKNKFINISGLNVYGKIKIDKIKVEYPIIEFANEDSLWTSICKISHNNIDGTGNLCLAGHNMRNLSMFGNLKNVEIGDTVEITNTKGEKFIYVVGQKDYIDYTETEVLNDTDYATLTLVTCKSVERSKRLVVRAYLKNS